MVTVRGLRSCSILREGLQELHHAVAAAKVHISLSIIPSLPAQALPLAPSSIYVRPTPHRRAEFRAHVVRLCAALVKGVRTQDVLCGALDDSSALVNERKRVTTVEEAQSITNYGSNAHLFEGLQFSIWYPEASIATLQVTTQIYKHCKQRSPGAIRGHGARSI